LEQSQAADRALAPARARREVLRATAAATLSRLDREIAQRLGATAEILTDDAAIEIAEQPADPAAIGRKLDRLLRERDAIGPVDPVAEAEAVEIGARIDALRRRVAGLASHNQHRISAGHHHRVTMARADRLYGVTMVETAVSRLVSVDLAAGRRLGQTA
jgi:chromosome segregation ATPase